MAQDPLHLLCIEPRFPGRLGAVADWLVRRRGYRCHFYCNGLDAPERWPEATGRGLEVIQFNVGGVAREASAPWTRQLERSLCYAYGCWEVLEARRPRPIDVILGRSAGLGSTLFAPVHLPNVPVVQQFDYYLAAHQHDLAEENGPDTPADYFHWRRASNAATLLELENGVLPWVPTAWQRERFPAEYRDDFLVLFDGVDTRRLARAPPDRRVIAGRVVPPEMRVVSFVARSLDRLRGFDRFVTLANALLRARSDVLCIAAGAPVVERGLDVAFYGQDYPAHVLGREPPHDPERFWVLGPVPRAGFELLSATDLHVYPSRPYVVARALVEAMACGAVVLAWGTEPVREFLEHGQTGLLASGPDDAERLALEVMADPGAYRPLGESAARLAQERYSQDVVLPQLARTFDRLVQGRR
ncbi:MAG: glycosyltransferase [Gemmataceae bacterium]|nr:glycosyltransferase [Gemmataceae bacterium]